MKLTIEQIEDFEAFYNPQHQIAPSKEAFKEICELAIRHLEAIQDAGE